MKKIHIIDAAAVILAVVVARMLMPFAWEAFLEKTQILQFFRSIKLARTEEDMIMLLIISFSIVIFCSYCSFIRKRFYG